MVHPKADRIFVALTHEASNYKVCDEIVAWAGVIYLMAFVRSLLSGGAP